MSNYVSTGSKILRHLDVLRTLQKKGTITPISLQIAPTSRCNLKCCFCSNVNRKKHQDLDLLRLERFLFEMRRAGAKTVEWTGGGDPTKYPLIKMFIRKAHELGYEQGFITNGIELSSKVGSYIEYLKWIRISLNSLDYVEDIEMPVNYKGTLGFSYVMNDMTDNKIIAKVMKYTKMYRPKYVRIVPNCQTSPEELDSTNKRLSKVVASWGAPFFYQMKTFHRPERCWWGYFKPFILHDGYVYRCSSVVLNDSAERSFHRKFRWMTMEDFIGIDYKKAVPYDCKHCSNCVFSNQNELIDSLLNDEMENFV